MTSIIVTSIKSTMIGVSRLSSFLGVGVWIRLAIVFSSIGLQACLGSFLSMWTQGHVTVLNSGQPIELDCEFYAESFNMFKNPVVWKKHQRQEQTEINIMGNILPPFLTTARFRVTFQSSSPRFWLKLHINDASLEDSGNYTCEVRGPRANVLASVTHYVFIRAPVQNVRFVHQPATMTSSNTTTNSFSSEQQDQQPQQQQLRQQQKHSQQQHRATTNTSSHHLHADEQPPYIPVINQITFVQHVPLGLRCICIGGYPPPELYVYLGERDITGLLVASQSTRLEGEQGLRVILYRTELWTDRLRLSSEEDGKTMRCVAVVSDVGSMLDAVKVSVQYGPVVRCYRAVASLDDRNVHVQCDVRARPPVTSLYWIIDRNGTKVSEGMVVDDYWALVMVHVDSLIETRLFMRKTTASSFRKYILFAENSIASTKIEAELIEKRPATLALLTIVKLGHPYKLGGDELSQTDTPSVERHGYQHVASSCTTRIINTRHLVTLSFSFNMILLCTGYKQGAIV